MNRIIGRRNCHFGIGKRRLAIGGQQFGIENSESGIRKQQAEIENLEGGIRMPQARMVEQEAGTGRQRPVKKTKVKTVFGLLLIFPIAWFRLFTSDFCLLRFDF